MFTSVLLILCLCARYELIRYCDTIDRPLRREATIAQMIHVLSWKASTRGEKFVFVFGTAKAAVYVTHSNIYYVDAITIHLHQRWVFQLKANVPNETLQTRAAKKRNAALMFWMVLADLCATTSDIQRLFLITLGVTTRET